MNNLYKLSLAQNPFFSIVMIYQSFQNRQNKNYSHTMLHMLHLEEQ